MKKKLILAAFYIMSFSSLFAEDYSVRFGFIGNSITIGTGLSNPEIECYPSQIGLLLKEKYGDTCQIANFAVSGRTMLKKGDFPIWNEVSFQKALNYAPDICFIMLGTNDSKPQNWDIYGHEFAKDYQSMIDTFLKRNPSTKFIMCLPPPAFAVQWGIRDNIIKNSIIPIIDSLAKVNHALVIDFYNTLLDSSYLFPDAIHPDARGAKVMAKIAADEIIKSDIIHQIDSGYTFVTSFESIPSGDLRAGDTLTLSWTTIRANQVFLNGQEVEKNGSIKLTPKDNTTYVLFASGNKNNDSLIINQKVYWPILSKILFFVDKSPIRHSDTVTLTARYYDQKKKLMKDTVIDVQWTLPMGGGRLIDKSANQIKFIADSVGKILIRCQFDTVFYETKLSVAPGTNVISGKFVNIQIYPNPANNQIFIQLPQNTSDALNIQIFNLKGQLLYSSIYRLNNANSFSIQLPTLISGNYILNISSRIMNYQQKITIK